MFEYDLEVERIEHGVDLSDDEKLSIFDLKELPSDRRDREIKVNHQNRRKLVALKCGRYALNLNNRLQMLQKRLEHDISAKTSKLSEMIKSKPR
ncbi:hypothetical protein ACERZ8_08900 [Tateyamaria armeniaca]|uniref:Uncharacterized protein n=1 Tax=Tateyamaria armeniaca TaxID=2518930 RepID=A0ABW8UVJ5_9RHOB